MPRNKKQSIASDSLAKTSCGNKNHGPEGQEEKVGKGSSETGRTSFLWSSGRAKARSCPKYVNREEDERDATIHRVDPLSHRRERIFSVDIHSIALKGKQKRKKYLPFFFKERQRHHHPTNP
ncbi:hypothetical protein MAP00_007764 [Monascus purpureus]|nr:hypothetical protein MAP00_007764 [Monascus purpureus]